MNPTSHLRGWGYALSCATALMLASGAAQAQSVTSVPLVLQDFSDCQNGNVADPSGLLTKGTAWIVKNGDGSLNIKVGITLVPNTTYHFYLKCRSATSRPATKAPAKPYSQFPAARSATYLPSIAIPRARRPAIRCRA
jgi:hypothetical protein